MKRFFSVLLIFTLLFVPFSTSAANEVYVGINNAMLSLTNHMPYNSGGTWYMDYIDFTRGDLGLSASYNKNLGTAVVYNGEKALVFDINSGTATINNKKHNQKAVLKNGTVYLPVSFVCEQFGISYSYLNEVSTLRLVTTSSMSDSMFVYIAKNRIPELLYEYNAKNTLETPKNDNVDKIENNIATDSRSQTIYVTIDIKDDKNLSQVLALLDSYNVGATLFLSKNAMRDDTLVRKVYASRHSIGIYADNVQNADNVNELLCNITKIKTRLLSFQTKIADAEKFGYRQWGCSIDGTKRSASQIISALDQRDFTVLHFDDSDDSLAKMKRIFPNIVHKNFTVRTIDIIMTPVLP